MQTQDSYRFIDHADSYPPVIPRAQVQKYFPWLSSKRLANLDNLGQGPEVSLKNGRAVLYPLESFLAWLDERSAASLSKKEAAGKNHTKKRKIDADASAGCTTRTSRRRGRKTKYQEVMERRG